jgi:hypothetical protein
VDSATAVGRLGVGEGRIMVGARTAVGEAGEEAGGLVQPTRTAITIRESLVRIMVTPIESLINGSSRSL